MHILHTCLEDPKLQYILRVSPRCEHPLLTQFDDQLRLALTKIDNITLTDDHAVDSGKPSGLVRRSGILPLQSQILRNTQTADEDTSTALKHWSSIRCTMWPFFPRWQPESLWFHCCPTCIPNSTRESNNSISPSLTSCRSSSAQWRLALHACSSNISNSACGLRLNNYEALRVAVGLRLGSELYQPYRCICGVSVDTRGSHALSCRRNLGRSQRYHFVNDLIWRSLSKAGFSLNQGTTRPFKGWR